MRTFTSDAACDAFGIEVARHWVERTSMPLVDPSLSMANALRVRDAFLAELEPRVGPVVGYKVAAVTPPAQRDLGLSEPLGGSYLAGMIEAMRDEPISVAYGARPIVEAKLLVAVGDERINDAHTPEEVGRCLAYLIPSFELGDSLAHVDQVITGATLTTYNVGARRILTGEPIPFSGSVAESQRLLSMVVTTRDAARGQTIDEYAGHQMMGNPLAAALWIVNDQRRKGVRLSRGDRLGLGAMSRVRPTAGQHIDVEWQGLATTPVRSEVRFRAAF